MPLIEELYIKRSRLGEEDEDGKCTYRELNVRCTWEIRVKAVSLTDIRKDKPETGVKAWWSEEMSLDLSPWNDNKLNI